MILLVAAAGLLAAGRMSAATFEGRVKMKMESGRNDAQLLTYAMKGSKLRMEMPAGDREMISLVDWDKREMSMLMPEQKMYMVIEMKDVPAIGEVEEARDSARLEKTSETATIAGREATKYLARDGKDKTELWLASGLGSWFNMSSGGGNPMKPKKLSDWEKEVIAKGLFPLRIVGFDGKGRQTMKMEVVELIPQSLDDALFVPPADYSRFNMGGLLKGLTGGGR